MWKGIDNAEYCRLKFSTGDHWIPKHGGQMLNGGYFTEWSRDGEPVSLRFEIHNGGKEKYYKWIQS